MLKGRRVYVSFFFLYVCMYGQTKWWVYYKYIYKYLMKYHHDTSSVCVHFVVMGGKPWWCCTNDYKSPSHRSLWRVGVTSLINTLILVIVILVFGVINVFSRGPGSDEDECCYGSGLSVATGGSGDVKADVKWNGEACRSAAFWGNNRKLKASVSPSRLRGAFKCSRRSSSVVLPLLLVLRRRSAPCPTVWISSSHRGFPPCCMRNISPSPRRGARLRPAPLGFHLPTRNMREAHDAHWAKRRNAIKNERIHLETRLGFPLIISDLTDLLSLFFLLLGGVNPGILQIGNALAHFRYVGVGILHLSAHSRQIQRRFGDFPFLILRLWGRVMLCALPLSALTRAAAGARSRHESTPRSVTDLDTKLASLHSDKASWDRVRAPN